MLKWDYMKWAPKQTGFTIVELLVVVVVIAILAAVTVVSYNGISTRAKASAAQSAAQSAAKKVLAYMITNGDQMPDSLATAGVTDSGSTNFQYYKNSAVSPQTFCITATNTSLSYYVDNTTQTSPTAGACAGHGANGATTITNLANDPRATSTSTANGTAQA